MSSTAAEVAEDYREALEDLTANSRFEISNLTVVARENTEHALAIAECLQEHIKKVPPQRKLPALYVLDSIVKNVGTPYTLFFGRKLYSTFMGAYASVDNQTRRKMDEMLKTWKEPVPGSIDTRPVFPPDVVRPIENALIKARTTALQAQQESIRGQQALLSGRRQHPPPPYRETPTPPGFRPGSHQPPAYGQHPPPGMNGHPQGPPMQQSYPILSNNTPQPQYAASSTPQAGYPGYQPPPGPDAYHQQQQPPQAGLSIGKLKNDIQQLIAAAKAEFAAVPHDTSVQTRLRALLDLQGVMQHQNLNQDQLALVRNQVAELSSAVNHINNNRAAPPQAAAAAPAPALPLPLPAYSTPTPVPLPVAVAPPPAPSASAPPVAATSAPGGAGAGALSLDALFGQGALATLLAGAKTGTPVNATPTPQPPPVAAIRSPAPALAQPAQHPAAPAAAPPADPMALMAILRQSGLLPPPPSSSAPPGGGAAAAVPPPPPPHVPVPGGIDLASILAKANAVAHHAAPSAPPPSVFNHLTADIQLKSSSLKKFRPHLIPLLHDDLGPPCTQCGRRFRTDTDAGRRKKTAHMDWHFRVHQRIAEAEKRGQHRSWYVDADDWVSSREAVDTDYVAPVTDISSTDDDDGGQRHGGGEGGGHRGNAGGADGGKAGGSGRRGKVAYIPVPEDGRVNTVCPICQEKFEMKWLDEAQEWVWMDAVRVGERAYHASCYGEATKGGGGGGGGGHTPVARGFTPEPVLGKRKAEDDLGSFKGKVKVEG